MPRPKSPPRPAALHALETMKRKSVAQLLFKCARLLNERAIARVNRSAGAPGLRPSHTNLFPHIDFKGVRITELARRLDISKQAVSQSVAELEEHGVVELLVDPKDARAKLVRFTSKGAQAIAHGLGVLAELELELEAQIGKRHLRALHQALLAAEHALEFPSSPEAQARPRTRPASRRAAAQLTRKQ
jgi:DNA-binding MarR family transcriptional regulator